MTLTRVAKLKFFLNPSLNASLNGLKILLTLKVHHIPYVNFRKRQCNMIFTRHSPLTKSAFNIIAAKHP